MKNNFKYSETPVNKRFSEAIEKLINRPEIGTMKVLAEKLGLKSQSSLTGMTNGAQQPTIDILSQLNKMFGIDANYIINGSEIKAQQANLPSEYIDVTDRFTTLKKPQQVIEVGKHVGNRQGAEGWKGLPIYNADISASFVEMYKDVSVYQPEYYLPDVKFKDCDFGVRISGDSMFPEVRHSDYILCKYIEDTRFISFGDIYYIVTTNGMETCKYINADPKNDNNYMLVPRNESIAPQPLPKDMLLRLYKVRGIIRNY